MADAKRLPFEYPPLMPDESLQGFVARIAGYYETGFTEYCGLVGIRVQELLSGRRRAVSRISAMTGIPEPTLTHHAFATVDTSMAVYRGQRLDTLGLRRRDLHGCPACIGEDIAASPYPPRVAAWFRGAWFVRAVRTCPVHCLGLVPFMPRPLALAGIESYDSVMHLGTALADLDASMRVSPARRPSGLEAYVVDRLAGEGMGGPLLDAMPLHAAVRTCEVVGAVALFGAKTLLRSLDDDAWRAAGGVGFDVVGEGVEGLRSLLSTMQRQHRHGRSRNGKVRDVFGSLNKWLVGVADRPDYDGVRQVVREHVLDTMPFDVGSNLLGEPVARRRAHSAFTACQHGRSLSKRLSRELTAMGVLADGLAGDRHLALDRPVEEVDALRAKLMAGLSKNAAAKYLSLTPPQLQRLVDGGLVRPLVHKDVSCRTQSRFAATDLDDFARKIDSVAPVRPAAPDGVATLADMSHTTGVGMVPLLEHLLAGRLDGASRRPDALGYTSILVDPVALGWVERESRERLDFNEAARRMQVNPLVPARLVAAGYLRAVDVRNRKTSKVKRYVEIGSFRSFIAEMVSLGEIAKAYGVWPLTMKCRLVSRGIEAVLRSDMVGGAFYRRSDVDAPVPDRPRGDPGR